MPCLYGSYTMSACRGVQVRTRVCSTCNLYLLLSYLVAACKSLKACSHTFAWPFITIVYKVICTLYKCCAILQFLLHLHILKLRCAALLFQFFITCIFFYLILVDFLLLLSKQKRIIKKEKNYCITYCTSTTVTLLWHPPISSTSRSYTNTYDFHKQRVLV